MRAAEAFKRAREADLPSLWAATGKPLLSSGSRLVSSWCPCPGCGEGSRKDRVSLSKEDGIWRWKCFACEQGGTAVDFVARLEGLDPIEAARRITGGNMAMKPVPAAAQAVRKPANPRAGEAFVECLQAMRKHRLDPVVLDYLGSRGIREATCRRAFDAGLLITLPPTPEEAAAWLEANVGRARMGEAGLWSKRWPAAAFRPLIFAGPTSEVAEFRSLGGGGDSPKAVQFGRQDYPLLLKPISGEIERIIVVEGGVDLLSLVDMGEDDNAMLVGLYGTGSWREGWAKKIVSKYPNARWQIATDADKDGESCANRIASHVTALGGTSERWRPFVGKDWNDALRCIAA